MSHLSVAKFGGTSVANYPAMQSCANIVIADPNTRVVVLSASAGVTNLLVALANGCEEPERNKLLNEVRQIQENILTALKDDSRVRPKSRSLISEYHLIGGSREFSHLLGINR